LPVRRHGCLKFVTALKGAVFLFALRRLGKKAWMLQYDNGDHVVAFLIKTS
jgi:hypothetical protein